MNLSTPTAAVPPSRRSRWAFSLRALLALVTLTAVLCAIYAAYIKPYRDERLIWSRMERRAASRFAIAPRVKFAVDNAVPEWLRTVCGDRPFLVIWALNLSQSAVTPEDFADLAQLRHLQALDLSQTAVTDKDLAALRACPRLWYLRLEETACTFEGLRHLPKLTEVWVSFPLTDEILRAGPPAQAITLVSPLMLENMSDAGLATLGGENVEDRFGRYGSFRVILQNSDITAEGVDALLALPIKELVLQNVRIPAEEQIRFMRREGRKVQVTSDRLSLSPAAFVEGAETADVTKSSLRSPACELQCIEHFSADDWQAFFARARLKSLRVRQPLPRDDLWETQIHLESLELDFAPSAETLRGLATLPRLRRLVLGLRDATAEHLELLRSAPALETLVITEGDHAPEHWRFVRDMPRLAELRLRHLALDAQILREIAAAGGINHLELAFTNFDDDALWELAAMSQLQQLDLLGVDGITNAGRERLQRRLPQLKVSER